VSQLLLTSPGLDDDGGLGSRAEPLQRQALVVQVLGDPGAERGLRLEQQSVPLSLEQKPQALPCE
jgi:hypothetical protein